MLPPDNSNDMMWILDFPLPQLLPVSFKNLIITIAVIVVVMLLIKKVTNTQATKKNDTSPAVRGEVKGVGI